MRGTKARKMGTPFSSPLSVPLRPASANDEAFLRELFACSRSEGEQALFASHPSGALLLAMQFDARRRTYHDRFPSAEDYIVLGTEGQSVGRLLLSRQAEELRLVDIALIPTARGQGRGTTLLRWVQQQSHDARVAVRLTVANGSAATRLYKRLGFYSVGSTDTDVELEWTTLNE